MFVHDDDDGLNHDDGITRGYAAFEMLAGVGLMLTSLLIAVATRRSVFPIEVQLGDQAMASLIGALVPSLRRVRALSPNGAGGPFAASDLIFNDKRGFVKWSRRLFGDAPYSPGEELFD